MNILDKLKETDPESVWTAAQLHDEAKSGKVAVLKQILANCHRAAKQGRLRAKALEIAGDSELQARLHDLGFTTTVGEGGKGSTPWVLWEAPRS